MGFEATQSIHEEGHQSLSLPLKPKEKKEILKEALKAAVEVDGYVGSAFQEETGAYNGLGHDSAEVMARHLVKLEELLAVDIEDLLAP